jgi:hypothetical protein
VPEVVWRQGRGRRRNPTGAWQCSRAACIDETMCTGARVPCASWRLAREPSPACHLYSLLRPGAREAAEGGDGGGVMAC